MEKVIFYLLALIVVPFSLVYGQADMILTNGKIFTSDTNQLCVQAVAIKGNKILAVGSDTAIVKMASSKTQRIDLAGKTVVPGFNDAHDHLGWKAPIGKYFWTDDFSVIGPDRRTLLDTIARLVKEAKNGEWIFGEIGLTVFNDTTIREALDSICPHNPVLLQIMWGHGIVANKEALKGAGVSDADPDPLGGWYVKNASGKIVALYEYAQWPLWYAYSSSEPENLIKGMRSFANEQIKYGITTVQNFNSVVDPQMMVQIFRKANLPQRIRIIPFPATKNGRRAQDVKSKKIDHHLNVSGIKYLVDGTPLELSSFMRKPYSDKDDWRGRLDFPVDTLNQILKEALESDTQLMLHVTGDSSLAIVLKLMKQLGSPDAWKAKRVRIEHNSTPLIAPDEVNDLKEFGLIMMHTPKYCRSSAVRSYMQKGIITGISPDGTSNPFVDIMIVTGMQDKPEENITREQAVIAYTRINAYAEFAEATKGTLMPGMVADLTVLSRDVFSVPAEELPGIQSVLTIVDGKVVYRTPVKN